MLIALRAPRGMTSIVLAGKPLVCANGIVRVEEADAQELRAHGFSYVDPPKPDGIERAEILQIIAREIHAVFEEWSKDDLCAFIGQDRAARAKIFNALKNRNDKSGSRQQIKDETREKP